MNKFLGFIYYVFFWKNHKILGLWQEIGQNHKLLPHENYSQKGLKLISLPDISSKNSSGHFYLSSMTGKYA